MSLRYNTGIRDPAQKIGINFTSGKFDLNNTSLPLSAFVDAMASLTSIIIDGDKVEEIQHDINESFGEDDALLLVRALPGCEKLFTLRKDEIGQHDDKSLVGKEAISRLQYAIRRLLKIICTHLNGLVLFIDDLQVRIHLVFIFNPSSGNSSHAFLLCFCSSSGVTR